MGPFGTTETSFVTNMGLFVFGFGVLGGIIFSIILTRYPGNLMRSAYIINILAIVSLAIFFVADRQANESMILVACGILGFFLLPILFVAYELAVM